MFTLSGFFYSCFSPSLSPSPSPNIINITTIIPVLGERRKSNDDKITAEATGHLEAAASGARRRSSGQSCGASPARTACRARSARRSRVSRVVVTGIIVVILIILGEGEGEREGKEK